MSGAESFSRVSRESSTLSKDTDQIWQCGILPIERHLRIYRLKKYRRWFEYRSGETRTGTVGVGAWTFLKVQNY
jgi:hypothetical protein